MQERRQLAIRLMGVRVSTFKNAKTAPMAPGQRTLGGFLRPTSAPNSPISPAARPSPSSASSSSSSSAAVVAAFVSPQPLQGRGQEQGRGRKRSSPFDPLGISSGRGDDGDGDGDGDGGGGGGGDGGDDGVVDWECVDSSHLEVLQALGIDEGDAREALLMFDNDLERASTWVFQVRTVLHVLNPHPHPRPSPSPDPSPSTLPDPSRPYALTLALALTPSVAFSTRA